MSEQEHDEKTVEPRRRGWLHNQTAVVWASFAVTAAAAAIVVLQMWDGMAESQPTCPEDGFVFVAGEPARASQINCNFSNVDARLDAVENAVIFVTTPTCPAGYAPYGAGAGRYLVGAPAGAPVGTSVGTALTDMENRPVGLHTHVATQGQHAHGITDPGHTHGIRASNEDGGFEGQVDVGQFHAHTPQTQSTTTMITINDASAGPITVENSGAVAGTPAPYIQLRVCVKAP